MQLTEAMNVYNPALFHIASKGYEISAEHDRGDEVRVWVAQKGNMRISGTNPLSLLGLIEVAERYSDAWKDVATHDLYGQLVAESVERAE
jgi:hypothetical protein